MGKRKAATTTTTLPSGSSPGKKKQKGRDGKKSKGPAAERKEDLLVKQLVKEWKLRDKDLARRFARNGIAKTLLELERAGFKCSESDPLLIISVDLTSDDSIGYFNYGNYGISAATGGHLPGPNVGQQGPSAVGTFLNGYEGVEDKSGGDLTVLYFESMGTMHAVRKEFSEEAQFCRIGPLMSARFGVPEEDSLVEFLTLDKMKSEPMPYEYFNKTP